MIIAQLSIAPVGTGTSLSNYVQKVINVLNSENINYQTNAMATVFEAPDIDSLFSIVKKAHEEIKKTGAQRIITELKIDDRYDKNATIETKLGALSHSK
jgi:uncharacterized protein (TIGR00106 family)